MIGFVTWPPLQIMMVQKDGQVTKPIIVVKMPKLLYIIQVKRFLNGYNFLALPDMQLGRQIETFQNVGGLHINTISILYSKT